MISGIIKELKEACKFLILLHYGQSSRSFFCTLFQVQFEGMFRMLFEKIVCFLLGKSLQIHAHMHILHIHI